MSLKDIAIVILNWNGKKHLETFLPSVCKYSEDAKIIVADNASSDDSLDFLSSNYPQIQTIVLDQNHGFCQGYNLALEQLQGAYDYYLLLNSDIEVTENYLRPLKSILKKDISVAACQPKILSFKDKNYFEHAGAAGGQLDYLGFPFCRGRLFAMAEKDEGQYNDTREIFWATGACMLVRAEDFHSMGGFDPNFFAHMEEIDLCWRLKNTGKKIMYTSESTIYHVGGGTLQYNNPFKTYLNFRNGLYLLTNNLPATNWKRLLFFRLILDGAAGLHFLLRGYYKDFFAVLKAHYTFYTSYKKWMQTRNKNRALVTKDAYDQTHQKLIVWQHFIKGVKTSRGL